MIELAKKQTIESKFTKYEIARILGARALQISMNAPVLLKLSKEDLDSVTYDPLKIAELELYAGILPITVKRPMPQKSVDKAVKQKEEFKEKAEEKAPEKAKEKEAAETDKEETPEAKEEEEIIKEVEGTEVMELATPEDEIETSGELDTEAGEE